MPPARTRETRFRYSPALLLHATVLYCLLCSSAAYAIQCECSQCMGSETCVGEYCFLVDNREQLSIKGCYNSSTAVSCGTSNADLGVYIHCCQTDMCNADLPNSDPTANTATQPTPQDESATTTAASVPSSAASPSTTLAPFIPPVLIPSGRPTSPPSDGATESATPSASSPLQEASTSVVTSATSPPLANPLECACDDCPEPTCLSRFGCGTRITHTTLGSLETARTCVRENDSCSDRLSFLCCFNGDFCNGQPATTEELVTSSMLPSATPITSPSCHRSDSSMDGVKLICSMGIHGCYTTWRRRVSDGSLVLRRGCSTRPCLEEHRNRKIKTCCYSSFCNNDTVSPFADEDSNSSADDNITQEPAENTTEDNQYHTSSPQTSLPPVTTETTPAVVTTVTQPTPSSYRPPILMTITVDRPSILPFSLECACDNCEEPSCFSNVACVTRHEMTGTADLHSERGCISASDVCDVDGVVCCFHDNFCNGEPPTEPVVGITTEDATTRTQATPTSNDTITTPPTQTEGEFPYIIVGTVLAVVVGVSALVVMVIIMLGLWTKYKREERATTAGRKKACPNPATLERKIELSECTPTLEQGLGLSECATTSSSEVSSSSSTTSSSHRQTSV